MNAIQTAKTAQIVSFIADMILIVTIASVAITMAFDRADPTSPLLLVACALALLSSRLK